MGLQDFKPSSDWTKSFSKEFGEAIKRADKKRTRGYRGTGSIALDIALGGGWGRSSVAMLTGKESSGKTLLFDLAAIEAQQKEKKKGLIFDFEGTWDLKRFESLGGDITMLDIISHDSCKPMLLADMAFDMLKSILLNTDDYAVICFDSTATMLPKASYEKKMAEGQEASTPFLLARTMSEGLTITGGLMANNPAEPTIFYVSQGRDNVNGASFHKGPPIDKQTGGRALPFFASVRVEARKGEAFRADAEDLGEFGKDIEIGHVMKVAVKKNKLNSAQGRVAEFDWYNEGPVRGIDKVTELIKLAGYTRTDGKSGSWYVYGDEKIQGADKFKAFLRSNPAAYEDLYARTKAKLAEMMDESAEPVDDETDEDADV